MNYAHCKLIRKVKFVDVDQSNGNAFQRRNEKKKMILNFCYYTSSFKSAYFLLQTRVFEIKRNILLKEMEMFHLCEQVTASLFLAGKMKM